MWDAARNILEHRRCIVRIWLTREGASAIVHSWRLKHTSSLPKYHFTVHFTRTLVAHSGESAAAAAMRMLTRCMSAAAICDQAAKAAQTAPVASQVAAATSASGIATGESSTTTACSLAVALALMEATYDHVKAAHAQLMVVTAQTE